jgi:hypothetical protein
MEKETKLNFTWIKNFDEHIKLNLQSTIPLNVDDVILYDYNDNTYHLKVDRRIYVPQANVLTIIFKEI